MCESVACVWYAIEKCRAFPFLSCINMAQRHGSRAHRRNNDMMGPQRASQVDRRSCVALIVTVLTHKVRDRDIHHTSEPSVPISLASLRYVSCYPSLHSSRARTLSPNLTAEKKAKTFYPIAPSLCRSRFLISTPRILIRSYPTLRPDSCCLRVCQESTFPLLCASSSTPICYATTHTPSRFCYTYELTHANLTLSGTTFRCCSARNRQESSICTNGLGYVMQSVYYIVKGI